TPYLCQIHEYIQETKSGEVPPGELPQRKAMTRILEGKLNLIQRDYVSNLCQNLDNEEAFCDEFLNVSYWSKISGGLADKIYAEDICRNVAGSKSPSEAQMKQCLARLKKENDLCLYG